MPDSYRLKLLRWPSYPRCREPWERVQHTTSAPDTLSRPLGPFLPSQRNGEVVAERAGPTIKLNGRGGSSRVSPVSPSSYPGGRCRATQQRPPLTLGRHNEGQECPRS